MTIGPPPEKSREAAPLGFEQHDHARCVAGALSAAEERSEKEGLRLTPVRRKALEILLRRHRALGAYEVLDGLREAGFGSQPPVAYRALDFLVSHGFAHKVERLNAFVACARPGEVHAPAFMICKLCASVAEAVSPPARGALGDAARQAGFTIEETVVEAAGICPACAEASAP